MGEVVPLYGYKDSEKESGLEKSVRQYSRMAGIYETEDGLPGLRTDDLPLDSYSLERKLDEEGVDASTREATLRNAAAIGYLDRIAGTAMLTGDYQRLQGHLARRYGNVPEYRVRAAHPDEDAVAFTDGTSLGVSEDVEDKVRELSRQTGMSRYAAGLYTLVHETTHMAQSDEDRRDVKGAEMDVERTAYGFFLGLAQDAYMEGDVGRALDYATAARYAAARHEMVGNDEIPAYTEQRDAA